MIPYPYNMVDMGGIDLAEANGTVVDGLYNRIVEAANQCGDVVFYNWKFAGIEIAPQHTTVLLGNPIIINGSVQVTEQDEVTVPGINPTITIVPLEVTENGEYDHEDYDADGFSPVIVNVGDEPALPPEYQEVEYITFDGNEFMLVENLPYNYFIDVVASNSVSMSESCVVGYREASNNDRDFEIRFQNGAYNLWARSGSYTNTVLASNPTGSALNVIRDIVVACTNQTRGKFLIGKYSTQNMDISFKGNLYAIKLYETTRSAGALTTFEASHKFIPCYRKADGEIGIYDLYTSVFYPNEGLGTLSKGPDVNSVN